jgi:riboflavin synthase
LTVSGLGAEPRDWFEVSLIPTTRELTTLGRAPVGTKVNLEVDVIAKYVERLLAAK